MVNVLDNYEGLLTAGPSTILIQHLLCVAATENFRAAWNQRGELLHPRYIDAWQDIDGKQACLKETSQSVRDEVLAIREKGFSPPPAAHEWIAMARQRHLAWKAYGATHARLLAFLSAEGFSGVRFYGGVKEGAAVEARIAEHVRGGVALDLWDLIRGRLVTPNLASLARVAARFRDKFREDILRVRNYWLKPRGNPPTPYRAIHFEISSRLGYPFELQLMTFRRDAVCLIDHSFFVRPAFALMGDRHERWMWRFSATANFLDDRDYATELERASPAASTIGARPVRVTGVVPRLSHRRRLLPFVSKAHAPDRSTPVREEVRRLDA